MLTVKEAAQALGVSRALIYSLIAGKQLGHVRIGNGRGILRIPEEAITAYLERQTVEPKGPTPPPARSRPLKYLALPQNLWVQNQGTGSALLDRRGSPPAFALASPR